MQLLPSTELADERISDGRERAVRRRLARLARGDRRAAAAEAGDAAVSRPSRGSGPAGRPADQPIG
jgi:hypothetical protein